MHRSAHWELSARGSGGWLVSACLCCLMLSSSPSSAEPQAPLDDEPAPHVQRAPLDDEPVPRTRGTRDESSDTIVCAIGFPRPRCASVVLFEWTLGVNQHHRPVLSVDLGLLLNIGSRDALGVAFGVNAIDGSDEEASSATYAELRYRRWLWPASDEPFASAIDLGVGVTSWERPNMASGTGYILEAAIEVGDLIALITTVQTQAFAGQANELVGSVGIRIGAPITYQIYRFFAGIGDMDH